MAISDKEELNQPLLEPESNRYEQSNSRDNVHIIDPIHNDLMSQPGLSKYLGRLGLLFLALAAGILLFALGIKTCRTLDTVCAEAPSQDVETIYTGPPLENVATRFQGTLTAFSPYKGPPSPQVDESWHSITNDVYISISEYQLVLSGFDPAVSVRDPLDNGHFLAALEYRHYLHCLEWIFKYTYYEYYEDWLLSKEKNATTLRTHVDHCIDLLRQYIECTADSVFAPFAWVRDHEAPYPNFNTEHVCRDINVVRHWEMSFARDFEVYKKATRSPSQKEMTSPP